MPATPTALPDPDPDDDRVPSPDYVTVDDLHGRGIDPALVRILCPWATELTGYGGVRCWAAGDLITLLGGV